MLVADRSRRGLSERDVAPGPAPDVPPTREQPYTHDFQLQAVMELKATVAVLAEKIDRLGVDVKGIDGKLDGLNNKITGLATWQARMITAAVVIAAIVGLLWTVAQVVPWSRIHLDPTPEASTKK